MAGSVNRLRSALEVAATVSIIAVSVYLSVGDHPWSRLGPASPGRQGERRPETQESSSIPSGPVSLDGAATQGSATGKGVALLEYSDFQCPFCGVFARDTLPSIVEKYVRPGKVLVAFRHFPLEQIHAMRLSKPRRRLSCAGRQGKFWQMHDLAFQQGNQLSPAGLEAQAASLGLNREQFGICLAGGAAQKVKADEAQGLSLGVAGTPTFFLGTVQSDGTIKIVQRLTGALPVDVVSKALDALLSTAMTASR